jgi:Cu-Zn family superoxide dismutase
LGQTHGAPGDEIRHVGDLGNIKVDAAGNSKGTHKDPLIKLQGESRLMFVNLNNTFINLINKLD